MEIALKETQTRFYALDLRNAGHDFSMDDGFNLLKLHVKEAEKDGALTLYSLYLRSRTTRLSATVCIPVGAR